MRLFLRPSDTFFFRDGRPFTRGEQSEGYSIETPFPSTVMGALRSAYIAFCGDMTQFSNGQLETVIGTRQSIENAEIQIKGVFLGSSDQKLYYSTPRDLVSEKKSDSRELHPLSLALPEQEQFTSSATGSEVSTFLRWSNSKMQVEHTSGYISCCGLRRYLRGNMQGLTSESPEIIDEPKVGIARSRKTLTADEGMLYRINMKRFRESKYGFVVDVKGVDCLPESALIKLGGEGKSFAYNKISQQTDPLSKGDRTHIRDRIDKSRKFKLYLATPAIFNKGWLPEGLHPNIELITAAVGNYVTVGGWDMAKNRPKSTYRAVPAGSVYYFCLRNSTTKTETILNDLHYQNIGDQRRQEGFGLAYVGTIS